MTSQMTSQVSTQPDSAPAERELVAAARIMLQRMGVDPADLMHDPADRKPGRRGRWPRSTTCGPYAGT